MSLRCHPFLAGGWREHGTKQNKTNLKTGGENKPRTLTASLLSAWSSPSEQVFPLIALKNTHVSRLFLSQASRLHRPFLSAEGTWCIVGEPTGWEPFPERFPLPGPQASRPADLEVIFASPCSLPLPPHLLLLKVCSGLNRNDLPMRWAPERHLLRLSAELHRRPCARRSLWESWSHWLRGEWTLGEMKTWLVPS